jgi:hypothetical protein
VPTPKLNPTPDESDVVERIWRIFPPRAQPSHHFIRARRAIVLQLRAGASAEALEAAAAHYAECCVRDETAPRFVRAMHNFYDDEGWQDYLPPVTVDGLTRDDWIRARRDVQEFDARARPFFLEPDNATP